MRRLHTAVPRGDSFTFTPLVCRCPSWPRPRQLLLFILLMMPIMSDWDKIVMYFQSAFPWWPRILNSPSYVLLILTWAISGLWIMFRIQSSGFNRLSRAVSISFCPLSLPASVAQRQRWESLLFDSPNLVMLGLCRLPVKPSTNLDAKICTCMFLSFTGL